jgi:ABC-type Fe3+-hydroxamate transport system substrate-binding protein
VTEHHRSVAFPNVAASHHCKSNWNVHDAKVADYLRIMRVVSLVPSWTEFLHDLKVDVVGQTKFCVRPEAAFRSVPRIGGTKTVDVHAVLHLQPDLVVANREENDRDQVQLVQEALGNDAVLVTDVRTVRDALTAMDEIGTRVGCAATAKRWSGRVAEAWGEPRAVQGEAGYAVWSSPWMVAGSDTFISDVMKHWGIANAFQKTAIDGRYPNLAESPEEGVHQAKTWLLPSEPFPFADKHLAPLQAECPEARFKLVDGEAFSWYGTRMLHVVDHLRAASEWVAESA